MKIAVASSGKTLGSPVNPRFGRYPYFLIVESRSNEFEAMENAAGQAFRGAGISAAQMIANKGVKVAIAGNFGPNAVNVLSASGVRIFRDISGLTVKEAINQYQKGKLEEVTVTGSGSFGRGFGMGRRGRW